VKPWVSPRFADTFNGIASGRAIAGEGTEIFITAEHYLRYYLRGNDLQFLAEVAFEPEDQVVGVDVADMDHNGIPEIYVSMLKGGLAVSQVYIPENKLLKRVKDKLPYLLRGIALEGKEKRIYAQKINTAGSFSGDIYELAKSGDNFTTKNSMQLPLFANLYNFNRFVDAKGKQLFVVSAGTSLGAVKRSSATPKLLTPPLPLLRRAVSPRPSGFWLPAPAKSLSPAMPVCQSAEQSATILKIACSN